MSQYKDTSLKDPFSGNILVTGGAGLIGSNVIWALNEMGFSNIIVVDNLRDSEFKWKNLVNRKFDSIIAPAKFYGNLAQMGSNYLDSLSVSGIIHLGACSSTTQKDVDFLLNNNTRCSQLVIDCATDLGIRVIYASSASTYGNEKDMRDDELSSISLKPMNPYAYSKQLTDLYCIKKSHLFEVCGVVALKYFNVFGPNEYHKVQPSPVMKFYEEAMKTRNISLFESHDKEIKDGEQQRDFLYSKSAASMTLAFLNPKINGGIYNIGSAEKHSFIEIAQLVKKFIEKKNKGVDISINFVDMPNNLKKQYQYNTVAKMDKFIANTGYSMKSNLTFQKSIDEYLTSYLSNSLHL